MPTAWMPQGWMPGKCLSRLAIAGVLLTLSACGDRTDSPVAATVNGDAVTADALAAETRASGDGTVSSQAENAVLGRIVNRKLLAQEAVSMKLDRTPAFRQAEARLREVALVEALTQKLAAEAPKPGKPQIDAYVARHPLAFGSRALLTLDQVRVASAAIDPAWLAPADSIADAIRILGDHHVAFERGHAGADTANLAPPIAAFIAANPGKPFAYPDGDRLLISQVVARQPAPVPADRIAQAATMMIRRDADGQAIGKMLDAARARATITYGDGFSAPQAAAPR